MTDLMKEMLNRVADAARKQARLEAKANFEAYFSDRNPHLKYLGISDPDKFSRSDLISVLEKIRSIERNKSKQYNFDRHKYSIVSTALMVEKERQSRAMDITIHDFKNFLAGVINAAD